MMSSQLTELKLEISVKFPSEMRFTPQSVKALTSRKIHGIIVTISVFTVCFLLRALPPGANINGGLFLLSVEGSLFLVM